MHYSLITSGNRVIQDAYFRDNLNNSLSGGVSYFETEAGGLMNDFPCIVIQGLYKYADTKENEI